MLKQRVIVGVGVTVFSILIMCLNIKFVAFAMALVALIGLSEIYSAVGLLKKQNMLCIASYLYTIVLYASITFAPEPDMVLGIGTVIYAMALLIYMVFNHDLIGFAEVSELFLSTSYVMVLFAHILLVRRLPLGNYIIWFVFITAWLSDTMAYFVGMRFGSRKLIPSVSPKKTVEGSIGGIAGCVVFNLIFAIIVSVVFKKVVYFLPVVILSIVAGVVSQIGDLVASCIKREHGIKDYSNLLPGHGGVLDRFDSVLFVAPTVYYFVIIFTIIA